MTQSQALEILKTGANVFLTGEPGSGKTYLVNDYIKYLKNAGVPIAITASTGIAATHLNGQTIHSWSGIGIKKSLTKYDLAILENNEKLFKRLNRAVVLIIDEISMLSADILDGVELICRHIRRDNRPFGGLQVILVGDFFQLPPVSSEFDENQARFAFLSSAWKSANLLICYLTEQHRQEDENFLNILKAIRKNILEEEHFLNLDKRACDLTEDFDRKILKLFSHNKNVDFINSAELETLPGRLKVYLMEKTGKPAFVEQLIRGCLSPEKLELKVGAEVMFTKNSQSGVYVNGTLGEVIGFEEFSGCPIIKIKSGREIVAEQAEWTIEDNGKNLASIRQIPLRLAWAMTVHKSQGMSLDTAFMDLRSCFAPGQGYVALSRIRSLNGLFLAGYNERALQVDEIILDYDNILRVQSSATAEEFSKIDKNIIKKRQKKFIGKKNGWYRLPR